MSSKPVLATYGAPGPLEPYLQGGWSQQLWTVITECLSLSVKPAWTLESHKDTALTVFLNNFLRTHRLRQHWLGIGIPHYPALFTFEPSKSRDGKTKATNSSKPHQCGFLLAHILHTRQSPLPLPFSSLPLCTPPLPSLPLSSSLLPPLSLCLCPTISTLLTRLSPSIHFSPAHSQQPALALTPSLGN